LVVLAILARDLLVRLFTFSKKRRVYEKMEEFMANVLQSGFSVAVASYLLIRMDHRLEELTRAVVRLGSVIEGKEMK
jgi:hypothetical protein